MKTPEEKFLGAKRRRSVPHEFVLEALADVQPRTNPMFGCLAVYVGEKIVMILRDKQDDRTAGKTSWARDKQRKGKRPQVRLSVEKDNGVWLATTVDHHDSLRREFPNLRSIAVFEKKVTGWQLLPADASDFEASALRACELVLARDERIGKVPKKRKREP